ncbi:hypothetical protein Ddye_022481 [Dipteronia dyeriana]|uniref:AB hydrolase-1 domain-containing protein n=1 Tax=Dipteronia dyeriana TaxID=168575 RepID=A0AAD9TS28_9ROSI|nr:hypothetical protein Ddye_022481 [Dipteronia dyeriana]
MVSKTAIVLVLVVGLLGMVYQATQLPPPPQQSQSPNEAPVSVSSPRIRLSDGRYLAYIEKGVPRNQSYHTIIIVHGFGSSKDMTFLAPQELVQVLGLYFLLYDRAGYGESDPNPSRTVKSESDDILQLADQLQIVSKFYLIGISMGSYPTWSCLKYIPHRLAGVAFIVPVINYQWPSLPENLISVDYRRKIVQWSLLIAKYAPGFLHWWATQKWFPSTNVLERNSILFNNRDIEVLKKTKGSFQMLTKDRLRDRYVFDILQDDFLVGFGDWEFDPMELSNPFPNQNESSVHIWQGYEDKVVPFQLQRYISRKLPWIKYHEVADGGHLIVHYSGLCESVLRALLVPV